jgi:hypothetical protein
MAIVQDGEQPGPKIGSFFPQVNFPEGMPKAILDEFVGSADITRQSSRVTPKTGNQGFDFLVKAPVDRSRSGWLNCAPGSSMSISVIWQRPL